MHKYTYSLVFNSWALVQGIAFAWAQSLVFTTAQVQALLCFRLRLNVCFWSPHQCVLVRMLVRCGCPPSLFQTLSY